MSDFFLDFSEDNPNIGWDQLKQVPGLEGVVLKVSEGVTVQDKMVNVRFNAATFRSILVKGLYHFYRPADDPNQQADNYIKAREAVTQDKSIPAIVDLEEDPHWTDIPEQKRYDDLHTFIQRLEQEGYELPNDKGVGVIVYTSHWFVEQSLPAAGFLGAYPLWVAFYGAAPPLLPPMWTSYWAWQFTGTGNIQGVEGPVDISYPGPIA